MNNKQFKKVLKVSMKYYPDTYPHMCNCINVMALPDGKISKWEAEKATAKLEKLIAPYYTLSKYLSSLGVNFDRPARIQWYRDLIASL